ncbi:MAG: helix-turn-helix transcriptional regulator [Methylovirgula sp.]|jgi:transcriptional regulator with XRE-family HTH domain
MISAAQLKAARALLGLDQRRLAELANLSLPTIQRMEASDGVVRGTVDSLTKLIAALDAAGIELIGEGVVSHDGGRGVRMRSRGELKNRSAEVSGNSAASPLKE